MVDSNDVVRCPECESGMLTTPAVTVRTNTTRRLSLPVKVCRRCKVMMLYEKTWSSGWKFWNVSEYVTKPR